MRFGKGEKNKIDDERKVSDKTADKDSPDSRAGVSVSEWMDQKTPVRRTFNGPRGENVILRIAVDRAAYAEVVAHTKESLNSEVCGVLVGTVCEDDEGLFVHIQAIIRGSSAKQGSTHVTFTQETWNSIHEVLEKKYRKQQIVGWYHSHPGFGVEFSEMDSFIHRNFFPGPTQVALVTDPLGGQTAVCLNTPAGIRNVDRIWIDGRESKCFVGRNEPESPQGDGSGPGGGQLKDIEVRVNQLVVIVDDLRQGLTNFYFAIGFLLCLGLAAWIGITIWNQYTAKRKSPEVIGAYSIPMVVDGKIVKMGVGVVTWEVPEEMQADLVLEAQTKVLMEKRAEEEAARKKGLEDKAGKQDAPAKDIMPEEPGK